MKLRLVPEERAFYDLFKRACANCQATVAAFGTLLRDFQNVEERARRIHDLEHEGDRLTAEAFALLNRTFITPFEREDIIALAGSLDDILDAVDEVATMLVLLDVERPSAYLLDACALLEKAVAALMAAIDRLESLRGIKPLVDEVHRLETEADGLYHQSLAALFAPNAYAPLDVLKWSRLHDLMEEAFDRCEDAANVLEDLVIKNG